MAGHTSGPWTFDEENPASQGFDVAQPDGGVVATAYYDVDRSPFSVAAAEANAHLIAAAPEILDALKWCAQWLDGEDKAMVEKVIAKAEGRAP